MAHVLICCILKFPPVYCNVSSLLFSCIGLRDDRPSTSDCLFVVNVIYVYYNSLMSSSSAAAIGSAYEQYKGLLIIMRQYSHRLVKCAVSTLQWEYKFDERRRTPV